MNCDCHQFSWPHLTPLEILNVIKKNELKYYMKRSRNSRMDPSLKNLLIIFYHDSIAQLIWNYPQKCGDLKKVNFNFEIDRGPLGVIDYEDKLWEKYKKEILEMSDRWRSTAFIDENKGPILLMIPYRTYDLIENNLIQTNLIN